MTVERVGLRAHERYAPILCLFDEARDARLERGLLGHLLVIGDAIGEQLGTVRAAGELLAEKKITDTPLGERCGESILIEMRHKARHWRRAHVGDRRDAGALDERDEAVEGVVRMP